MRRRPLTGIAAAIMVCSLWAAPALAQHKAADPPPAGPGQAWRELRPDQAQVLAPLSGVWSTLGAEQQRKWVELSGRYPRMNADERRLVQERMREWAAMTPQERQRARVQFQQASQLSPEERLQRWQAYQSLPPQEREQWSQQGARGDAGAKAAARPASPPAAKSTLVVPPPAVPPRPAAPAAVQAAPGATTRSMTQGEAPPLHQQTGLPKLVATPEFVDRSTLLPKRGAQAAPVRPPGAQAPAATPPPAGSSPGEGR